MCKHALSQEKKQKQLLPNKTFLHAPLRRYAGYLHLAWACQLCINPADYLLSATIHNNAFLCPRTRVTCTQAPTSLSRESAATIDGME